MSTPIQRRPARARRGFTLTEVLVSMLMISIIGVALTRLVVTQSRFSNKQVLQRNARGVSRGALNIMESELRMVEQSTAFTYAGVTTGVQIPPPTATTIIINVPWAVGIRCSATDIAILPVDSISQAVGAANTVGVAWRDAATERYVYDPTPTVQNISDFTACTTAGILATGAGAMPDMRVVRLVGGILSGGTPGTPVMLFYRVRYQFATSTSVPGRLGLFRSLANASAVFGTPEELVAPFATGSGFRYFIGTDRSATTSTPSAGDLEEIAGVQLNLFAVSERNTQGRATPETSNLTTPIFFRNRISSE